MSIYRILINGQNYLMHSDGTLAKCGFYQTHWIQAPTKELAEKEAINRVRATKRLKAATLNAPDDPPLVVVDECDLVTHIDDVESNPTGFAFYPEEAEP